MSLDYVKSQEMICDASDSGSNSKLSISEQIDALITDEHLQAVNRRRRIIFQDDVLANGIFRNERVGEDRLEIIIDYYMSRIDAHPNQIDSVWHEWGEGNKYDVDPIPEACWLHNNDFRNNGYNPAKIVKESGLDGADLLWDVTGYNNNWDEENVTSIPPTLPNRDWSWLSRKTNYRVWRLLFNIVG